MTAAPVSSSLQSPTSGKLRLACADFTFPLLTHEESLKLIALLGFEGVDIGLFEDRSHSWPSREFADLPRATAALRRKLEATGLQVADVFLQTAADFRPWAINHPDSQRRARARDWYLKTLEYAAGCGCRHVTTLPGVHFETEDHADSFERSVEELAWRVDQAQQRGIVFAAEAHVGSIAPDPESAAHLVQSVPGLTLTLDYTHFIRSGRVDADVEPLLRSASHFHVRGARTGRLQAPFKDSTIDYRRVYSQMLATGYQGWIGLEYVWLDWEHCNECDNLSETILYRDLFREMIGERP